MTQLPIARPAAMPSSASGASPAARATRRSCWRSIPRARRKRTTNDPAATKTAAQITEKGDGENRLHETSQGRTASGS